MCLKHLLFTSGNLACKLYEEMRREAAVLTIQKNLRWHFALKSYRALRDSAVILQTGLRAMAARNVFRHKKQTKAAVVIQVKFQTFYPMISSFLLN